MLARKLRKRQAVIEFNIRKFPEPLVYDASRALANQVAPTALKDESRDAALGRGGSSRYFGKTGDTIGKSRDTAALHRTLTATWILCQANRCPEFHH